MLDQHGSSPLSNLEKRQREQWSRNAFNATMAKHDRNVVLLQLNDLMRWRRGRGRWNHGDTCHLLVDQLQHDIALFADVVAAVACDDLIGKIAGNLFERTNDRRVVATAQ